MRRADWDQQLLAYLNSHRSTPFEWGSNDCCLFSAGAIQAMTGVDIAEDFRGYTSEVTAFAAIKRVTGQATVEAALAYCGTKYGLQLLDNPLFGQRGDLALLPGEAGLIAGIVGPRGVVSVGASGISTSPLAAAVKVWRV